MDFKKCDPRIYCLQETRFGSEDTNKLKAKGLEKIFHANSNCRRAWVAILISHKIDCNQKKLARNKKEQHSLIKVSTQQKIITVLSVYTPRNRPLKHMKQKLIEPKGEIYSSVIIEISFLELLVVDRTT